MPEVRKVCSIQMRWRRQAVHERVVLPLTVHGGDAMDACGGNGGSVAAGVMDGVSSTTGVEVAVNVAVAG